MTDIGFLIFVLLPFIGTFIVCPLVALKELIEDCKSNKRNIIND